jgi:hypothetical protein
MPAVIRGVRSWVFGLGLPQGFVFLAPLTDHTPLFHRGIDLMASGGPDCTQLYIAVIATWYLPTHNASRDAGTQRHRQLPALLLGQYNK